MVQSEQPDNKNAIQYTEHAKVTIAIMLKLRGSTFLLSYTRGGGGRPLGFGRQLPPQLTVGRRPLVGAGGGWEGVFWEGRRGGS